MKKFIVSIIMIFLIIVLIVFAQRLFKDESSFNKMGEVIVYFDGVRDNEYEHHYINEQIYISANYLMKNKVVDFYWDREYKRISIFNNYKYEFIDYKDISYDNMFVIEKDELFFNANFIRDTYKSNIYVDKDNLKVIIDNNIKEYKLTKKSKIKYNYSSASKTLKGLEVDETIYVYNNEVNDWILCRTEDNVIGFVKLSHISPKSNTKLNSYPALNRNKEIKMAWDLLYSPISEFKPFDMPDAIDIIAPTWFELRDDEELFTDISNDDYIKYVHSSNKSVWGVFNNSFNPELTSVLLNDGDKRSKIVDEIIRITKEKGLDGINIDFENMYLKDKDVFSAFVKELYCKTKEAGIIMSIDITILSNSENWSLCYDRNVIGEYSDYIMLMAYDENVSSVGSVSSIPWVEYGVKNILEYTYSDKVVLSIPFYTRLWELNENKELIKTTALRIETAKRIIEELEIDLTFDEATQQNYGEVAKDGIKYIVWNEDETSLRKRLEIVDNYKLNGIAVWALSYGTEEMWSLLD